MNEDYSTLPEEFENKRWKCKIDVDSIVDYEYSAVTYHLVYDCEDKLSGESNLVAIQSHVELGPEEVYKHFGDLLNEQLEVLDRHNANNR
jgi:hypothetical protein